MEEDSVDATYHSFLLRLWHVEQNGTWTWRCSLEESMTGRRQTFANLEALTKYLQDRLVEEKEK